MPCFLKLLFFIFLKLSLTPLQAQSPAYIDSLENALIEEPDSFKKTRILAYLAYANLYSKPSQGIEYAKQMLALTPKDSLRLFADTYNFLGITYAQLDSSALAIYYLQKAIDATKGFDGTSKLPNYYMNLATAYYFIQDYELALKSNYQALTLIDSLGGKVPSPIYTLLMSINLGQKEYIKARNNAYLALKANPIGINCYNMGLVYIELERFDSAAFYFEKALEGYEQDHNQNSIASTFNMLAKVSLKQQQIELAAIYINKAIALEQHILQPIDKVDINLTLAEIYLESKDYQKSILSYQKTQQRAKEIDNFNMQLIAVEGLAKNYAQLNNMTNAYQHLEEALALKDSISEREKQEKVKNFETKYQIRYDVQKKEQENVLLSKNLALQKLETASNQQRFYGILFLFILGGIISYLLFRQSKATTAQQILQLKHRLLRNQMNPHFIFNALIAIQNFVYKNDPRKAGKYLSSFAKLVRAILENSRSEYISLSKEIQWLENYLNLQLLRFNNKFTFDINIDDELDLESVQIPPMLTQPFIENALEHGIKNIDYQGELTVSFSLQESLLVVEVLDNGIGLKNATPNPEKSKHISLATTITKERLAFLNKKSRQKIYFDISTVAPSGTLVSFSIPIKELY